MATIKYLIQSNSEQASIFMQFSIARGKVLKRKTGYLISPKKWSTPKGQPILKDENTKELKINLDTLKTKIEVAYNNAIKNGKIIDGNWLQDEINIANNITPVLDLDLLTNYIDYIIQNSATRKNQKGGYGLSTGRIKVYQAFKKVILRYQESKNIQLYIRDVNLKFAKSFTDFLLKEEYALNTIGKFLANLKTVCNDANVNGIEVSSQLPMIKVIIEKKESEEIVYLSFEELNAIENLELSKGSLINARRWLMLGCYIGQRGGDLLNLTQSNVKQLKEIKVLELVQEKTGKNVVIPLLPKALEIIEKGFPKKLSIQKFNDYLKEICRIADINKNTKGKIINPKTMKRIKGIYPKWQLISSHVCRRSFASNFYGDIPTPVLMGITGHSSESIFLNYIGKSSYDNAYQMVEYFNKINNN